MRMDMELQKLMEGLQYAVIQYPERARMLSVTKLVCDSRDAVPGAVFVCLKGIRSDGHRWIYEACEKGAAAVVVERLVLDGGILSFPKGAVVILVKDTREAFAEMSAAWFSYPAGKLKLIGVTGTKGKTTVTWMIWKMLQAAGIRAGLIGTIVCVIGEKEIPAKNTTPDAFTICEYFARMIEAGCEYAVMEVSSQGVKQKRIEGIPFEVGVFTNLGEDHIGPGEHADAEEYRYYKALFFQQCRVGIGNLDDRQCGYMFRRTNCKKYGFTCQGRKSFSERQDESHSGRILTAEDICVKETKDGPVTEFTVDGTRFSMQMPGRFNVYNALAALQTVRCLGLDISRMAGILAKLQVRGRMERIWLDRSIACYIDYAHNAMSLAQALKTLRGYHPARILLVFGCGGNRAKSRRSEMGETAGRLADLTILTSDNPRFEDPEAIIRDIEEGMKKSGGSYRIIADRREAVAEAIAEAGERDVVLIAGKGHEDYQEVCGVRTPMDDRELIHEAMNRRI